MEKGAHVLAEVVVVAVDAGASWWFVRVLAPADTGEEGCDDPVVEGEQRRQDARGRSGHGGSG